MLQVPLIAHDAEAGTVTYRDEDGSVVEQPVTGGLCKLQWKPDWAMRWVALGVDYEMSGKDLIPSVQLAQKIARVLGGNPPEGFSYELFLDEKGQKISKSKGNGLAVEDWLRYAPTGKACRSICISSPRRAKKKLYFRRDSRGRSMNTSPSRRRIRQGGVARPDRETRPWHIHAGIAAGARLSAQLQHAAETSPAVANAEDPAVLWGFISRYAPEATPANAPFPRPAGGLRDRLLPGFREGRAKQFRAATEIERAALAELSATLATLPADSTAEAIQTEIYEIGQAPSLRRPQGLVQGHLCRAVRARGGGPRNGFVHPALRHRRDPRR